MPEIKELLEREAGRVPDADFWLDGTMAKVRRRRRSRALFSVALSLAIAAAGLLVATRAFPPSRSLRTATEGPPNYEMSARIATPGEQVPDAAGPRGEHFVWIHVEVRWDPADWPGVHRCTWEVLDEEGVVVSSRGHFYLPHAPIERGRETFFMKMLELKGEPVEARAGCEPHRLDTPGIAELDPPPQIDDWEAWLDRMEQRVDGWAERFQIDEMPPTQLAGNMWALWGAMSGPAETDNWRRWVELSERLGRLCVLLPPDHEFRGGEFCD